VHHIGEECFNFFVERSDKEIEIINSAKLGDKVIDVREEGRGMIVIEEVEIKAVLAKEKESILIVGRFAVEVCACD
jgi:hypothetical protein